MPRFGLQHVFFMIALVAIELTILVAIANRHSFTRASPGWVAFHWLVGSLAAAATIRYSSQRSSWATAICFGAAAVTLLQSAVFVAWRLTLL